MEDLISVIVPVYNVEKYLSRCINSILKQTYRSIEIILVDDGSKDQSGNICDTYARNAGNIRVIHKENAGLGFARNSGLDISSGKYIVFVDSDDYLEEDMISNLYSSLVSNGADACIGGFKRVFSDKVEVHKNEFSGRVFHEKEILEYILPRMLGKLPDGSDYLEMSVWKVLFSADIIKKYSLRFPSERELISEDVVFDLDYYTKCNTVCMCEDVGYCYCDNEGTLTTRYRPERFQLQKKLYLYVEKKTADLGILDLSRVRRMTTFISNTRYCIKLEAKFVQKNGRNQMKKNIKAICNDDLTKAVFNSYDHSTVPLKSRIVNLLIKHQRVDLLILLMTARERLGI